MLPGFIREPNYTIFKFEVPRTIFDNPDSSNVFELEPGHRLGKILSAGLDPYGHLCVWALISTPHPDSLRANFASDPECTRDKFTVLVACTGGDCNSAGSQGVAFVGTVVEGPMVWHVFAKSGVVK